MQALKSFIYNKIYLYVRFLLRLNITKTIYINFKTQSFKTALKFPIFVYGKINIMSLRGKLIINGPIRRGMIKIGYRWLDLTPSSYSTTGLMINGTCIFDGYAIISGGASVMVQWHKATLRLGNYFCLGGGNFLKAMNKITIGPHTRIASNCVIMDSNMHFIKNVETGKINKPVGEITIGKFCWINQRSIIYKGSVIPDYSVVAASSLVNKDFSGDGTNLFLAGSPAKPANSHVQRIFAPQTEYRLAMYFAEHPEQEFYMDSPGVSEEPIDNTDSVFTGL